MKSGGVIRRFYVVEPVSWFFRYDGDFANVRVLLLISVAAETLVWNGVNIQDRRQANITINIADLFLKDVFSWQSPTCYTVCVSFCDALYFSISIWNCSGVRPDFFVAKSIDIPPSST